MLKILLLIYSLPLTITACSFNTNTGETKFDPLAYQKSLVKDAKKDITGCSPNNPDCEKKTAHDNYEGNKLKAMSNEELEEYAKHNKP